MEQIALCNYLDATGLLWCHVPNGMKMGRTAGKNMQRQGMKSGVPDVLIFVPCQDYNGLAIELKRTVGGRVSDNQVKWLHDLEQCGWCAVVCYGAEAAIEVIKECYDGEENGNN
jgi:hypothetical protein